MEESQDFRFDRELLEATVLGKCGDEYYLRTVEGDLRIPDGLIAVEHGAIVPIGDGRYLQLNLQKCPSVEEEEVSCLSGNVGVECEKENLPPTAASFEGGRQVADWPTAATRMLIDLYKEKKLLVEQRKIKTLKHMWEIIRGELNKEKYSYTTQQCESKWKSLERSFKNKIASRKRTGEERKACPFEKELSEILTKRRSIFPSIVMDAGTIKTGAQLMEESGILMDTELRPSSSYATNTAASEELSRPSTSRGTGVEVDGVHPLPSTSGCITEEHASSALNRKERSKKPKRGSNIRREVEKLREFMEERNEWRRQLEERKFEQRERLISELRRRNNLLEELIAKK